MKMPRIKYLWMFVTEKCNLNCEYCFYKFRDGKTTIPFRQLKSIIDAASQRNPPEFVISGGEPLLEWELVKDTILYIRKRFRRAYVLIQTNGTLLDRERLLFIKENSVNLEFGIDGDYFSDSKHRKGTTRRFFGKIMKSISESVSLGTGVSITLTVHPDSAQSLLDNFVYLLSTGANLIEITPAAFESWGRESIRMFKKQYLSVLRHAASNGALGRISMEYDRPIEPSIDLIVMANGKVITNWALLSLPREARDSYSVMSLEEGGIKTNEKRLGEISEIYAKTFSSGNFTYRDFSTLNSKLVYDEFLKSGTDLNYEGYYEINSFLKKVNRSFLDYERDKVREQQGR